MWDYMVNPIGTMQKGFNEPYEKAGQQIGKIEPMLHQYYDPYVEYGQRAMPTLEEQYAQLLGDPGGMYASMGQGFQESPGYQFSMDQAMNAGNQAMGAGGMLGTPAHQQQNMGYAQGLANQDYQNYMNQMMNMYGKGLSGTEGQLSQGYQASTGMSDNLSGLYGTQANLGMSQAAARNEMIASLLGAAGGAIGAM